MNTPKRRKINISKNPFLDDHHSNSSILTSTPPPPLSHSLQPSIPISSSSPPPLRGSNPFNPDSIISEAETNCDAFNNLYLDSLLYSSNDTFISSLSNNVQNDSLERVREYIYDYERRSPIDPVGGMRDGRENPFGIDVYSRF